MNNLGLLIFEVLFVIFFSIFILGKFRQKDYDMSYKIYQIYGLPLISILIKGELEILAINIISLLVTSGVGYFGELLTISQLENVVWISIGIILLSAILEAIFFWQNVIKINVYNHSRRK